MVQIIRENRKPTFAEQVNRGLGSGLDFLSEMQKNQALKESEEKEDEAFERLTGMNMRGLSRNVKEQSFIEKLKMSGKEKPQGVDPHLQNSFNEIVSLIPKVGRGTGILSTFGGESAKNYGKFASLSGALEGALVKEVNKGALSNERFEYIKNYLLPTPTDTRNEIRGKLEGLATVLGLDTTALTKSLEEKPSEEKQYKHTISLKKKKSIGEIFE